VSYAVQFFNLEAKQHRAWYWLLTFVKLTQAKQGEHVCVMQHVTDKLQSTEQQSIPGIALRAAAGPGGASRQALMPQQKVGEVSGLQRTVQQHLVITTGIIQAHTS
jgi:hypothetical protein